ALLRPDVVWFGEIPKGMDEIGAAVASCDLFVTVGSSGAVYPAAGLASHVRNFPSVRTGRFARTIYVGLERPENAHSFDECGLGKAAPEMLAGARASLGNALEALAFAVPAGAGGGVLIEGGHPLPDEGSLRAGEALLSAAASLRAEDAALLLVSGGGSALAEAPRPPLTLEEVRAMNDALVRSG